VNKIKRCLLVVHRFYPFMGGAERLFFRWARELEAKGYVVDVYTTNVWDNDFFHYADRRCIKEKTEKLDNINIRRFGIYHPPNKNNLLKLLAKLPSAYLKYVLGFPYIFLPGYCWHMAFLQKDYDFVLAGVFPHYYLVYPALSFARKKKIPFICVPLLHFGEPNSEASYPLFFNSRSKEILKLSDLILTQTDMERDKLVGYGYSQNKIITAGIGIDPVKVWGGKGGRFKARHRIEEPVVLQISTQTHDKGSHHIIEAAKILWARGIKFKLVMIGQILKDFEDYLLMQGKVVFENTIILNYIDEQEKKDALDACDMLVMASRSESFGLTYPEAWLYRKPVIGAYCSGVTELIEEGVNGYLIPFGDKLMLAEYIVKLLKNKELAQDLGIAGYKKVMQKYLWEQRLAGFEQAIRRVTG